MQSPLTAVVLCIFAQAAAAQVVTPAAATTQPPRTVATQAAAQAAPATPVPVAVATPVAAAEIKSHVPAAHAQPAHAGGELIKTAAAGTRDELPPTMSRDTSARASDDDHPRRGGTAMLLAALALMSGIALRRFGGPRE